MTLACVRRFFGCERQDIGQERMAVASCACSQRGFGAARIEGGRKLRRVTREIESECWQRANSCSHAQGHLLEYTRISFAPRVGSTALTREDKSTSSLRVTAVQSHPCVHQCTPSSPITYRSHCICVTAGHADWMRVWDQRPVARG